MYIMLSKRETRLLILITEPLQSTVLLYCFICILKCARQAMYMPLVNKQYYYTRVFKQRMSTVVDIGVVRVNHIFI